MKKSVVPRKQVNVRLKEHNINLMNRAAVMLDMTQAQVVEKALELFARRNKITVEEPPVSPFAEKRAASPALDTGLTGDIMRYNQTALKRTGG